MHKLCALCALLALGACGTQPSPETLRLQNLTWAQAAEQMKLSNGTKIVRINGVVYLQ